MADELIPLPPDSGALVIVDDKATEEFQPPLPYPVVGIGASAGGVEAYIEVFSNLSPNTGMAFVLIPHLLADHKSHLTEILSRHTSMPVQEVTDGTRPEPDQVYILPPNRRLRIESGILHLESRAHDGVPRTIDYFFHSLAADLKTGAVGVVLSGTDGDGALGLKAIKGEGGITLVQSPDSARFSEMPRSSISADNVDRILPPAEIAGELAQLGRQFRQPGVLLLEKGVPAPDEEQHFVRILKLLHSVSGIDFRLYKPTTIRRRIARRMLLHRVHNLAGYAAFVKGNPRELAELQEDTLISVTRFFRDPPVFETLKQIIIPRILEDRRPDQQVRIWVAGCASGEEAYSIAICFLEYLTGRPFDLPIQIFGTDASDQNIQKARAGMFPESIAGELSPERLRRFFIKVDKGYQVSKRLRDLCIFARQNLCHDPPFSKMDLISCRNVLIYFGAELQTQILPVFHYALRSDGFLLLGTSETIREFTDLFQLTDRKHKFFAKIGDGRSQPGITASLRASALEVGVNPFSSAAPANWGELELQRAADRIVLARYGPAGVIINEKFEILQSRGRTSPYLEMAPGAATLQLTRMLRDGIASPVSQAVSHAVEDDVPVRVQGLRVTEEGEEREVTLEVLPIHTMAPRSRCFLILFVPQFSPPQQHEEPILSGLEIHDRDQLVERLRQDLSATKLYLQTLLEERDAKNQELVSANEEIQSANEEMQSTNEELETTKEELQSSNEELQTVNDELQQRNAVLTQTSNDLSNLLNSVNLPVLMLSNDFRIRHFTPPTQRLMNLRAPDIGRPLSEIRMNLAIDDLYPLFSEVLETLTPREVEVQDREGRWYLLRMRPYRTTDNKIDGLVVVLLDIDQLRRSQQEVAVARDFARSIIENVPLPLAVVDLEFRIRSANDAFRTLAGTGKEDLDRRSLPDLAAAVWSLDGPLRSNLEDLRSSQDFGRSFEFTHQVPGEKPEVLSIRGRALKPDGEMFLLLTFEDVSAHKEVERLLSSDRERLASQVASTARELGRTQDELRALAGSLFNSQEDERRRVARELHDDICQRLAVLEIDTQQIHPSIDGNSEQTLGDLESLRSGIAALSEEVRRISHALHPSVIDDLGIAAALRSLVDDFRERERMIATFAARDVPGNLPDTITTGLYRITQEGLRNIAKHAGKTHVKVNLKGIHTGLRLEIIDHGEGFDVTGSRSGLGLISMEERARMMEASFKVESQLGIGTRITVDVPLPANPPQ